MLPTILETDDEAAVEPLLLHCRVSMGKVLMIFALGLGVSLLLVGCVMAFGEADCERETVETSSGESCDTYAPLFLLAGGSLTVLTLICLCRQ